MKIVSVIESKVLENTVNGRTASIYGSAPWLSEAEKANWKVVVRGWTFLMSNGTVGFGRPAVENYDDAVEIMKLFNAADWEGFRKFREERNLKGW